jgi:hypothetical protein
MNAIALDPGITTGYAQGSINDGVMTVVSGQSKFNHAELWQLLLDAHPDYIIFESFEFRHGIHKRHGAEMYPRELIGVVLMFGETQGCEVVKQQPMKDSPTTFFNNKRLKELGMYKPAQDHGNDALRHLLYWAKFKGGSQFVKEYKQGVL